MLDLHKHVAVEQVPQVNNMLQRQLQATDKEIDQLVYQLYELSDAEIKIVEEGASKS